MIELDMSPDTISCNTIIHGCAKAGRADEAFQWLSRMKDMKLSPDESSYNSVIYGFAKAGDLVNAVQCFESMSDARWTPDAASHTSLIQSFGRNSDTTSAARWFSRMTAPDLRAYNALLYAHAGIGDIVEVDRVFERLVSAHIEPDLSTWKAVILACAKSRPQRPQEAENAFRNMLRKKCFPDQGCLRILEMAVGRFRCAVLCKQFQIHAILSHG